MGVISLSKSVRQQDYENIGIKSRLRTVPERLPVFGFLGKRKRGVASLEVGRLKISQLHTQILRSRFQDYPQRLLPFSTMNALKYSNLAVTAMPVTSAGRRITSPTPSCTSSINDSTVTNSNASTTTAKTTHTQLPADFEPSSYSVICGKCYNTKKTRRWRRPLGPIAYMHSVRSHSNLHYLSSLRSRQAKL